MPMEIHPTHAALGAEIRGIDLSLPLDDAAVASLIAAWHAHQVLLIRDQSLSDLQLAAFSRRFGDLDTIPSYRKSDKPKYAVDGLPEVAIISNVIEKGVPIGALGAGEAAWHTDMSYVETPPVASILYALEVPPVAGDTSFANMYAAHDALPESLRLRIAGRKAAHDASYNSAGELRQGFTPVTDVRSVVGARHPIIWPHPRTRRAALYLGRRLNAYIEGLPVEESEALLDALWAHCSAARFVWTHRWRVGDVLMWDNRCVIHRRDPFDVRHRRIMHRTQVKASAIL